MSTSKQPGALTTVLGALWNAALALGLLAQLIEPVLTP